MVQDIDTLFSTIEKVHPDMYAVYPKQKLEQDIEKVKSEIKPSGDIFYFYKEVAPLVVNLGDGHTNLFPPFFPPFLVPEDFANFLLFPFSVKVTYPDEIIRVQKDYTKQNIIPIGAQITSINNIKADSIVQEMMNYSTGEKEFYRIDKLELAFTPLMCILYQDSVFDIDYLFNQGKHSVQVKGISHKERYENQRQNSNEDNKSYTFSTLPDKNIGIIEFNECIDLDRFKVFLDSTFQVLQKENIGNLIIDVRKNGGGESSLGEELCQYISPVPFAQYDKTITKYSDILKQYKKTKYNQETTNPNGIEIYNSEMIKLRENPLRYKGNVFLLISHHTFSAASDFSWNFKYFKMGTIVGEETGGMNVCFGDMISLQLPNTGLFYGISYKKWYSYGATDDDIHGTLPDYNVEAENALDFTIDLITQRK